MDITARQVKAFIKKGIKTGVDSVITGEKDTVKLIGARPNDVIRYLVDNHGAEFPDVDDTNGWQWDYWFYFDINGKKYCLSGDGFYQDYATFREE